MTVITASGRSELIGGAEGCRAAWRRAFGPAAHEGAGGRGFAYRRLRRRLATGRRDTFSGFCPSRKTGRMVAYESLLERMALQLLEEAPVVVDYLEQPERETWTDGGKTRRYTADFGALTLHGIVYVEVKPCRFSRRPETLARHRAIRTALEARGIGHVVWTERIMVRPSWAVALLRCAVRRVERIGRDGTD